MGTVLPPPCHKGAHIDWQRAAHFALLVAFDAVLLVALCRQEGRPTPETAGTSLPHCSVSNWALLVLLLRWATAGKRHGGFDDERHKQASLELLWALLRPMFESCSQGFVLSIDVTTDWTIPWPRPVCNTHEVQLTLSPEGFIDLGRAKLALGALESDRRSWWSEGRMQAAWGPLNRSISLVEFLSGVNKSPIMLPLLRQVVWQLGMRLQALCLKAKSSLGSNIAGLIMTEQGFIEVLTNAPLLDRMLVQYTESAKKKAADLNITSYSVSTDKASVGGLGSGLMASIIGLGTTNCAVLGVPQVGLAGEGGESQGPAARPVPAHSPQAGTRQAPSRGAILRERIV